MRQTQDEINILLPVANSVDSTSQLAREDQQSPPSKRLKISTTGPSLDPVDTGQGPPEPASLVVKSSSIGAPQGAPTEMIHPPITSTGDTRHSHPDALRNTSDVAARPGTKRKHVDEVVDTRKTSSSQSSWSWWRQGEVRWPSPSETRPYRKEATNEELQDIEIRRYWEIDWAMERRRRNSSAWNSPGEIQRWIKRCCVDLPTARK